MDLLQPQQSQQQDQLQQQQQEQQDQPHIQQQEPQQQQDPIQQQQLLLHPPPPQALQIPGPLVQRQVRGRGLTAARRVAGWPQQPWQGCARSQPHHRPWWPLVCRGIM